jgi:hypothetical protein
LVILRFQKKKKKYISNDKKTLNKKVIRVFSIKKKKRTSKNTS